MFTEQGRDAEAAQAYEYLKQLPRNM